MVLYNLAMRCYAMGIGLLALWNTKVRKLRDGQRETLVRLNDGWWKDGNAPKDLIWIHCASLGEFEMAKPIAAALQAASSQRHILFTFFSPSGYEHSKLELNQSKAYLPLDRPGSAKRCLAQWNPSAVIFIRYDFWYHFIQQTLHRNIPCYALGVSLTPHHWLFKSLGKPWLTLLKQLNAIGVINPKMHQIAIEQGLTNTFVFGDTKFNRAVERTLQPTSLPLPLQNWLTQKPTLILGSAWQPEIDLILQFFQKNPEILTHGQILIAPHNINTSFCEAIQNQCLEKIKTNALRFSECSNTIPPTTQILILDTIGHLAESYRFGSIALIGGAFGKGLHNTIEAAAFGLPLIFGPNHQKFPEAEQFIQAGCGFSVANQSEFDQTLLNLFQSYIPNQIHPLGALAQSVAQNQKADISAFCERLS